MAEVAAKDHSYFYCVVCTQFFNNRSPHNLSANVTMKPPASYTLGDKRPLLAAMHSDCYQRTIGREAEFSGQWPDESTCTRFGVDSIANVPVFYRSTEKEGK